MKTFSSKQPFQASQPSSRRWIAAALVVALAAVPALSQAQGRYGGHWHGGWGWGPSWGVSLGIGLPLAYAATYPYGYYGYPSTVVVAPPPVTYVQQSAPATPPAPATRPDPVVYPRNGQSAEQTEADTRACNSWAATVPRATADASVFQRATEACMDGRGYTLR